MTSAKAAGELIRLSLEQLLEGSAWFVALEPRVRDQVRADIREQNVAIGQFLARRGETQTHWYGVLEGLLKWSSSSPDGRSVTLGGLSVGSWFGEGSLLRGTPRPADIIALRHSRIAALPLETFHWLHQTQLSFNHFLLQQMNERLHWFMGDYSAHRLLDVDHQVARALSGLFHPLFHPRGGKHLQISQEEIANLAGVSRQRCNSALTRLKEAGYIQVEYGGVTVNDLNGLLGKED
jgi:CRP-like cAMP-binding protein